jgi:hypothetical protein
VSFISLLLKLAVQNLQQLAPDRSDPFAKYHEGRGIRYFRGQFNPGESPIVESESQGFFQLRIAEPVSLGQ